MNCLTDIELEQIAEQIKQGYTSGRLDNEDGEGVFSSVVWELKYNKWWND